MIYLLIGIAVVATIVAGSMRSRALSRGVAIGALGLLAAVPLAVHDDATINLLADAGLYVILALGLNVVVGFAGLLDLGYAAFFAIGAYTYGMLASPQFGIHVPFWLLLFVAALLAALFGTVLGAPTLRLRGDYLAIVTLGFGEIVPQIFQNLTKYTGGPNGISALDIPRLGPYSFGLSATPYYEVTVALVALTILLVCNLRASRLGRAWTAIREDELAAKHAGIDTTRTKLAAFALGASFSGLAGVVFAAKLSLVSPDLFQFQVSVLIVSMLVLGGMGNVAGVIVGSLVLSTVNEAILPQADTLAERLFHLRVDLTADHYFIYGAILVAIMLLRPEGLLPNRERRAELHASADA
jgi:branched-chain amino acid transport system permease protein